MSNNDNEAIKTIYDEGKIIEKAVEKIVTCKLHKEDIPELMIHYSEPVYNIFYGAQYNFDFTIIYDLHRYPAERILLYYNDLDIKSNNDILKFKNDNTAILNLNYTQFVIDDKLQAALSNNRIIKNNLSVKNPINLTLNSLSFFFKFEKKKNLLIKFNSCIYSTVPQLIYLYKSCFKTSEIFKSAYDNRLKDSILFYGEDVITDRVVEIKKRLMKILNITKEDEIQYDKVISGVLKPDTMSSDNPVTFTKVYVHSLNPNNGFVHFLKNAYIPFISKVREDVYVNLNYFNKSLGDKSKNINNKYQKILKDRLKSNSVIILENSSLKSN